MHSAEANKPTKKLRRSGVTEQLLKQIGCQKFLHAFLNNHDYSSLSTSLGIDNGSYDLLSDVILHIIAILKKYFATKLSNYPPKGSGYQKILLFFENFIQEIISKAQRQGITIRRQDAINKLVEYVLYARHFKNLSEKTLQYFDDIEEVVNKFLSYTYNNAEAHKVGIAPSMKTEESGAHNFASQYFIDYPTLKRFFYTNNSKKLSFMQKCVDQGEINDFFWRIRYVNEILGVNPKKEISITVSPHPFNTLPNTHGRPGPEETPKASSPFPFSDEDNDKNIMHIENEDSSYQPKERDEPSNLPFKIPSEFQRDSIFKTPYKMRIYLCPEPDQAWQKKLTEEVDSLFGKSTKQLC